MSALLLLGAAAAYALAAFAYFRGRFGTASLLGLVFLGLVAPVAIGGLGAVAGGIILALLAVAPGVYLVVHCVDARRGLFLLPTIYSIPIAFVCALVLLALAGLGLLL